MKPIVLLDIFQGLSHIVTYIGKQIYSGLYYNVNLNEVIFGHKNKEALLKAKKIS